MPRKLKIGYDASSTLGAWGGIPRYAIELLRALVAAAPDCEFVVLLNSLRGEPGERHRFLAEAPNVRTVRKRIPGPLLVEGWRRTRKPSWEWLVGEHCDVVMAPASYIPPADALVVATVHDLGFLRDGTEGAALGGGYFARAFPEQLPQCAAILTPSEFVAEDAIAHFQLDPGRVHWVHSGIDSNVFRPDGPRAPAAEPYILAVTSEVPRKRTPLLFEAYAEFRRRMPFGLRVVGAKSSPLLGVDLLGPLTDEELAAQYRGAAATLLCTREEGFGFPLLESLACGTPVVCGRNSSLAEIGGDWPCYAEEETAEGFAQALLGLLEPHAPRAGAQFPATAAGLASAVGNAQAAPGTSRQEAAAHAHSFTWERTAREVLAVLHDVAVDR